MKQPDNFSVTVKKGKTSIRTRLEWKPSLGQEYDGKIERAQVYLDSEVLRRSTPYMPIRTGTMIKSGALSTTPGTGEVIWKTPYVRFQYYGTAISRPYDSQRGGKWFERMKADQRDDLVAKVKRKVDG